MRESKIFVLVVIGVLGFAYLMKEATDLDQSNCEVRLAEKLKTTAVYINGRCMVKGYGRVDGR